MAGITVRHDRDAVFTSYAWLRALLLDAGVQVSYSENGAKGNPWIESFWAPFKHENHSLLLEAETLDALRAIVDQQMRYYDRERRRSGIGNRPPLNYLESEGVAARALHSTPGQLGRSRGRIPEALPGSRPSASFRRRTCGPSPRRRARSHTPRATAPPPPGPTRLRAPSPPPGARR
jgi:hypothetical protein